MRILSLLLIVGLVACGGSSSTLRRHAVAAQLMEDVSASARVIVLDTLRAEMEAAVADETDPDKRRELADEARARFEARGLISSVNALIEAKTAYVRAVLLHAQDDRSWSDVLPLLNATVAAYENLRAVISLPPIPVSVTNLLPEAR